MKTFESEAEATTAKVKLEEDMKIADDMKTKEFSSLKINWISDLKNWKETKARNFELIIKGKEERLFLLAHDKDKIEGKAQMVHQTLQRIPMIRKLFKVIRKKGYEEYETQYKFIDDRFDRRTSGEEVKCLAFDFWVYRVNDHGKEHYLFSEKELSKEHSEFYGTRIHLDDLSDLSNTLKIKKVTSLFICKSQNPSIKVIGKDEMIELAKEVGWDKEKFMKFLFVHPSGRIFDYPEDFKILRAAQLLSSKYEDYPLHLFKMGPVGTGKTTEMEVLDGKFEEEQGILESANSTLKVLVPSFKEKPANLGYICNCNRVALIDELMKMVEQALSKAHDNTRVSNYFGQMNMLLEHKERMVGSGNDNSTKIKATSKINVTTNNISNKNTIGGHIGLIDATTLSRFLIWVQDYEETEMIYCSKGSKTIRTHQETSARTITREQRVGRDTYSAFGVCGDNDSFLTIYDSCQQFLVDFDEERCEGLFRMVVNLIKGPMQQVWKARGLHHTILLLDGLVKFRCLFEDKNPSFTPEDKDYEALERILRHMVTSWDTNFDLNSWKENFA